jgi:uncharacterized membrane protein SpoIIM required for sporulation
VTPELVAAQAEPRWRELEKLLRRNRPSGHDAERFLTLYRAACDDLALARQRKLDVVVIDRLNQLVTAGHQILYRPPRGSWRRLADLLGSDFPRAVRAEGKLVLLAHLLFYGAAAAVGAWLWRHPDMVYAVMDPATARSMEHMYDPAAEHYLKPRSFDSDAAMFGFYIYNNISIAFRAFASGALAGIGSLVVLLFNGVFLGAVGAHVANAGFGMELLSFVIGHGSFELTALVLASVAGMRLGVSIIAPGELTRAAALAVAAKRAMPIVYGAAAMLVLAATLEAFWSSSRAVAQPTKLIAGIVGWVLVAAYLGLAGRWRGSRAR